MDILDKDTLLECVRAMSLEQMEPILKDAFFCSFVIDPWNKRIMFSDRMAEIMGDSAYQEMPLDHFFHHVPEDYRTSVASRYGVMISDMISSDQSVDEITHPILDMAMEQKIIHARMQIMRIDKTRYIVGNIYDETTSVEEIGFKQLLGDGINSYLTVYDTQRDRIILSNRFVQDFDLESNVMENFSININRYLAQEDAVKVRELFDYFNQYGVVPGDCTIKLLAPGKGELYLRTDGFSLASEDSRYVSAVFSDISEYKSRDMVRDAMIAGSDAVTFTADFRADTCYFSDNIDTIFPGARTSIPGDFIEEIAQSIIPQDRKRFRNALNRAAHESDAKFAIEFRLRTTEGKIKWIACRGKSYEDRIHQTKILTGVLLNLSSMNEVKEQIEKKESSHELTGLPTRDKMISDCDKLIKSPNTLSAALIVMDIQNFHSYNDRYGKTVGDAIVTALAGHLNDVQPEESVLYHIGVDSFALLWPETTRIQLNEYLSKLSEISSLSLATTEGDFFINVFAGVGMYPMAETSAELLNHAEIALHKAKETRDSKYKVFSPTDKNELDERLDFEGQIAQSINNKMENFQMYYQPLIDAKTGRLAGAEALLRWQASNGQLVNPEIVVAALEKADKMADVGRWIANEAVKQCAKWISKGAPSDFYIHINATADDLIREDYADEISELLKIYNLSPDNILIELTETSIMKNMAKCRKNLELLKQHNIRTALDDFGSGYSSFNYLKELPVDEIKIDKTFVDDMETVEFNRSFISAMTMLAHSIGKSVVVEGVESEIQAQHLREMDIDIFQGYLFGKPMSVFAFWNQFFA